MLALNSTKNAATLLLANLTTLTWLRNFSASDTNPSSRYSSAEANLGTGLALVVDPDAVENSAVPVVNDLAAEGALTVDETGVTELDSSDPAEQPADDEKVVTAVITEPVSLDCVELGPFSNEDLASMAAVRLRDIGFQPTLRESGGQIRSGFWVYLPPYQTRQDAEQAVTDLREQGVTDLFVVTGSEQLNAVSLGLYSYDNLADQRAAAIGKIGYTPRIVEHFRDATVFWIEYRENADNPLTPEDVGVFANAYELPEKKEIVCGSG